MTERIGAVVVTYHAPPASEATIEAVSSQVERLVVVDNGSDPTEQAWLRATAARYGAQVIANATNRGIAAALNQGVCRLADEGFAWVLLFDQDSRPVTDLVERLLGARASAPESDRPALVGANFFDPGKGEVQDPAALAGSEPLRRVESVITSGTLLSTEAYRLVGPFREDFFIDYVDLEYCFRLRRHGYGVAISRDVLMTHTLGAYRTRWLWRVPVRTSNHAAVRHYFITRNHLLVFRQQLWAQPRWALVSLCNRVRIMGLTLLLEPERRRKLGYIAAGVLDAIRARTDRNPLVDAVGPVEVSGARGQGSGWC
ncbi:MAG: glycosyltransferase [Luteitalea sp.]|nr:glycosyltransferase [Luteitalea sp.]